jgi:hypothetical protein
MKRGRHGTMVGGLSQTETQTRWPQLAERDRASERVEGWDGGSLRERAASKTEHDQRGL